MCVKVRQLASGALLAVKQSNMAGYRTALIAGDYRLVKGMAEYRKQIGQIIPAQCRPPWPQA